MKLKKIKNRNKIMSRLAKGKEVYYIEHVSKDSMWTKNNFEITGLLERSFQYVQKIIERPDAMFFKDAEEVKEVE